MKWLLLTVSAMAVLTVDSRGFASRNKEHNPDTPALGPDSPRPHYKLKKIFPDGRDLVNQTMIPYGPQDQELLEVAQQMEKGLLNMTNSQRSDLEEKIMQSKMAVRGTLAGPFAKIWSDEQCPNVGNFLHKSLHECRSLCYEKPTCTAFNYRANNGATVSDCVLRACQIPIPQPESDYPPYNGYITGCGGEYTSDNGMIQHPINGGNYKNNDDCIWTIRATGPIRITFNRFNTEDRYDYLYVRDGDSSGSTLLGAFDGSVVPDHVQTSGNAAYVQFTSDYSITQTGFEITWVPVQNCPIGSVKIADQCLVFRQQEVTWYAAKDACEAGGGTLASLADPAVVLQWVAANYGDVIFWVGGTDTAGSWKWLSGAAIPLDHSQFPWSVGNPNNDGGNQDCLTVNFNGGFDDDWCTVNRRYICELGINLFWPKGSYGLPKPISGCPSGAGWYGNGYRYQDTEDGGTSLNSWSSPIHLEGIRHTGGITQHFCMKDQSGTSSEKIWPRGKYCIYQFRGSCPTGFRSGYIHFDDEDNDNRNTKSNSWHPDGHYDHNTKYQYCCRTDGNVNDPIQLPTDNNFYLFPYGSKSCQKVTGMLSRLEYIRFDTEDSNDKTHPKGFIPYIETHSNYRNPTLFHCYYTPIPDPTCVCGKVNRIEAIVGGSTTEENEYPWQVALVNQGSTFIFCGGSLINDRWVLTAAHCTQSGVTEVLLGNHFRSHIDSTEIRVNIATVVDHPSYNKPSRLENDFALLELATPLNLEAVAPHIRPVCLPNAFNPSQYEDVNAVATGWGQTSPSGPGAETLQEVTVRTMTNSECHKVVGDFIRTSMICATAPGVGHCFGDSGGPLVRVAGGYFNQIGVASWVTHGCAGPNFISGYGRVTDAIDWIKSTSSSGNTCAPPN